MTRRARLIFATLGTALVAAVWVTAPGVARRSPFFAVQRVEVEGVRYLDEYDVVRRLSLPVDGSVLDPVEPVAAAARAIPGVVSARVSRRLPGTLRVSLLEAIPVALAQQPDQLVMLDHRAKVLPFDPTRFPTSLPVSDHDAATTTLLAHIMLTDPVWYAAIESASRVRDDVVIEASGQQVRLRPDADRETLRSVTLVRNYLTQHNVAWREIDGRFAGRVFVRRARA